MKRGAKKTAKQHAAVAKKKEFVRETLAAASRRVGDLPPLPIPPVPQDVPQVLFAFPATVIGTLLPEWDVIPADYKQDGGANPWRTVANRMFGAPPFPDDVEFHPREGVDAEKAWRHLYTCMRSYEPRQQHKIAGVAWLASCFFKKIAVPSEGKEYASA